MAGYICAGKVVGVYDPNDIAELIRGGMAKHIAEARLGHKKRQPCGIPLDHIIEGNDVEPDGNIHEGVCPACGNVFTFRARLLKDLQPEPEKGA